MFAFGFIILFIFISNANIDSDEVNRELVATMRLKRKMAWPYLTISAIKSETITVIAIVYF